MKSSFAIGGFLWFLLPWRNNRLVTQMGGEVARECRAGLLRRVYRRTADMSVAEIRGYVRAQAAGYVEGEVVQALGRRYLKATLHDRVVDSAVDQLVGMIVRDVLNEVAPAGTRTLAA